ncbi:MAG: hypothetical protein QXE57_05050 [Nitrososphaerales archaeon]
MNISPISTACHNFKPLPQREEKATVIIVPIKIHEENDGDGNKTTTLSWSCNRGSRCWNRSCTYAYAHNDF